MIFRVLPLRSVSLGPAPPLPLRPAIPSGALLRPDAQEARPAHISLPLSLSPPPLPLSPPSPSLPLSPSPPSPPSALSLSPSLPLSLSPSLPLSLSPLARPPARPLPRSIARPPSSLPACRVRARARACVRAFKHTHTHTHTHRQAGDESGRMVSSWWRPAVGRLPPPDPPRRQGGPCAPETRSAPPCRRPLPEPPPDPPRPASCRCYLSLSPPCWGVGGGRGYGGYAKI